MKNFKTKGIICGITLSLFSSSCAHHRDVRPGSDGVHRVVVHAPSREAAEQNALAQARHYCDEKVKEAAVIKEETKYTGAMDEATRDAISKASDAAMILGGTGSALGRKGVRTGGNVVGSAGVVGKSMSSGNDYQTEMTFKCQ